MLKIALCDDNCEAVKRYAELLSQIAEKWKMEIEISCFYSGESLLFHYTEAPKQVDIIYLDILMDQTDGMETARKLRECSCEAQIVFLTSYEDYVYEAFDVNAVQYLLKEETSIEKFEKVFLKAAELASEKEDELFIFEFDGKTHAIPIQHISYFEIWKRLVTVHYQGEKTGKFYGTMEQLENQLFEKNFVRVHRSYLVNLPYISVFQNQAIRLKTEEVIPVGVTFVRLLKKRFSDYISDFHIYNTCNLLEREEKL